MRSNNGAGIVVSRGRGLYNYYGVYWQEGGMDFDIWCGHKHATLEEAADCIEIELIENYDAWITVMAHTSGNRRKLTSEERADLQKLLPRRKVA